MAERRMFTKTIIDSDAFLDMPLSSHALYFHLSMRADDDGFINNPKKIMKLVGANQNDYDLLLAKSFIIKFDDGICVIKHWRMHNYIQKDRYKPTVYSEHKAQLYLKSNKSYTLEKPEETECLQNVYIMDTQSSLGQSSQVKSRDKSNDKDHFLTEKLLNVNYVSFSDDLDKLNVFFENALTQITQQDALKITNYIITKTKNKEITNKIAYFITSFQDGINNLNNASSEKDVNSFVANSVNKLRRKKSE